jgi:protein gp37
MISYNPWHGCSKYSEGCKNCYVYRMDKQYGRDPSKVAITQSFDLPIKKTKTGEYKYKAGITFFTCYTSDFFLPEMKEERKKVLEYIHERNDCMFYIITKRIDLVDIDIPDNVEICCTIENQKQADYRLPIFKELKAKHKSLCLEPLLEQIEFKDLFKVEKMIVGGESGYGPGIRLCKEEWIKSLYQQAKKIDIPFCFKQTGTNFITLDGTVLNVARKDQFDMAKKIGYRDFDIDKI